MRDAIHNGAKKTATKGIKLKLDLSGRKKVKWQGYQAYSNLYYQSKLKNVVDEGYTDYCASLPLGENPESIFKWRNNKLRELYEAETDEVKAEVEVLRKKGGSVKDLAELDAMLAEGLSGDAIRQAIRKS